jgi:hypothetical protein
MIMVLKYISPQWSKMEAYLGSYHYSNESSFTALSVTKCGLW